MSPLFLAAALTAGLAAHSALYSDATPPARFRGDATMVLQFEGRSDIVKHCESRFGAPPAGYKTDACFTGERAILPNPCRFPRSDAYAHMLCHELGHANGWPKTHGD